MQRLAEFEEGHDDEGKQLKSRKDFRRVNFSCQWKRNTGKMVADTAMSGWSLAGC
jgi:hypothetical protein